MPTSVSSEAVDWFYAEWEHRLDLPKFVCADPARMLFESHRGKYHPKKWEHDVQSWMRNIHVPTPVDSDLLLGYVDGELASMCHYGFDVDEDQMVIMAIATSVKHRRKGLATRALRATLGNLRGTKNLHKMDCGIFTRIHEQNMPSKALFAAEGFEYVCPDPRPNFEVWVAV